MKRYNELTEAQQEKAIDRWIANLLDSIASGELRFRGDDLQERIDGAVRMANRACTPWFVGGYIMDTCREEIRIMAICNAEDRLYPELDEQVVFGVV